jgi:hypothetical protein
MAVRLLPEVTWVHLLQGNFAKFWPSALYWQQGWNFCHCTIRLRAVSIIASNSARNAVASA